MPVFLCAAIWQKSKRTQHHHLTVSLAIYTVTHGHMCLFSVQIDLTARSQPRLDESVVAMRLRMSLNDGSFFAPKCSIAAIT